MLPITELIALSSQWTDSDPSGVRWTTIMHQSSIPFAVAQHRLNAAGRSTELAENKRLSLRLEGLKQEITGVLTSWHRLDWMKSLVVAGTLTDEAFGCYAACDIGAFHVRMRSAFDYLATLAWGAAQDRNGVGGSRSFSDLIKWLRKNGTRKAAFGPLYDTLFNAADWFEGLRGLRDLTVHQGGFTLVFPSPDAIGFRTLRMGANFTLRESTLPSEVMCNDNIVDFRKYGCLHLCRLISLSETVMKELLNQWDMNPAPNARCSGGAVEMLPKWAASF